MSSAQSGLTIQNQFSTIVHTLIQGYRQFLSGYVSHLIHPPPYSLFTQIGLSSPKWRPQWHRPPNQSLRHRGLAKHQPHQTLRQPLWHPTPNGKRLLQHPHPLTLEPHRHRPPNHHRPKRLQQPTTPPGTAPQPSPTLTQPKPASDKTFTCSPCPTARKPPSAISTIHPTPASGPATHPSRHPRKMSPAPPTAPSSSSSPAPPSSTARYFSFLSSISSKPAGVCARRWAYRIWRRNRHDGVRAEFKAFK